MSKYEEVKNGVIFPIGEKMMPMHNILLVKATCNRWSPIQRLTWA